jgi:enolase-phosphatase E1
MMKTSWVLTDIEGTTSSISFVHDVLFPYARQALPGFIAAHAEEPAVAQQVAAVQSETGAVDRDAVVAQLLEWIDQDVKATPLKALQGLVWQTGYEQGDYQAHLYQDVQPALQRWQQAGVQLAVYSSGSIKAQELFFRYSVAGDLRSLFSHHFDTTTGPKKAAASYQTITSQLGAPAAEVLFLSDSAAELHAAAEAGLHVCGLNREGSNPLPDFACPVCSDFLQVEQQFLGSL